ncbi:MAG: nucleotide exchange factor GrpE [Alphaproteobacteria bacterium]
MTEDDKQTPAEPETGAEDAPATGAGKAETDPPVEAAAAEKTPEERIAELAAALAEANDRSLRNLAEMENIRRRAEREKSDTLRYGASGLARDLLNAADNLRRALQSVPPEMREGDEAVRNFVLGVEMTEKELLNAFEKHGIRQILPLGEKFNHAEHQAMFEVPGTDKPAGTIVELMQPGYIMHDRLLRPAMVGVAKGDPEDSRVDTTA